MMEKREETRPFVTPEALGGLRREDSASSSAPGEDAADPAKTRVTAEEIAGAESTSQWGLRHSGEIRPRRPNLPLDLPPLAHPPNMKTKSTPAVQAKADLVSSKLGDNKNEDAVKLRKTDKNFSQSRDIHESRGTVQSQRGGSKGGMKGH